MTGLITFTSIHNPQLFTDKELEAFFKLLFKPFLNRTNSNQEKAPRAEVSTTIPLENISAIFDIRIDVES